MRLFKKGNKITFIFKFYQYTHHLRGVMVGILLKILPHALTDDNKTDMIEGLNRKRRKIFVFG